ncbi:MAG: hypothetical protein V4702_01960 [Patescibacteria group bacterium]
MDIYAQIITKIIEQQESIIGPVAIQQAQQITGIKVDWPNHQVVIQGDAKATINSLIEQYKTLFGQIAVEVSKDAVAKLTSQLSDAQLPESLK